MALSAWFESREGGLTVDVFLAPERRFMAARVASVASATAQMSRCATDPQVPDTTGGGALIRRTARPLMTTEATLDWRGESSPVGTTVMAAARRCHDGGGQGSRRGSPCPGSLHRQAVFPPERLVFERIPYDVRGEIDLEDPTQWHVGAFLP